MMHRACAAIAATLCPSLKRDIENGCLAVRQVFQWRAQVAIMDEIYVESLTGNPVRALGHGKVELIKWRDRDLTWLERKA